MTVLNKSMLGKLSSKHGRPAAPTRFYITQIAPNVLKVIIFKVTTHVTNKNFKT